MGLVLKTDRRKVRRHEPSAPGGTPAAGKWSFLLPAKSDRMCMHSAEDKNKAGSIYISWTELS